MNHVRRVAMCSLLLRPPQYYQLLSTVQREHLPPTFPTWGKLGAWTALLTINTLVTKACSQFNAEWAPNGLPLLRQLKRQLSRAEAGRAFMPSAAHLDRNG